MTHAHRITHILIRSEKRSTASFSLPCTTAASPSRRRSDAAAEANINDRREHIGSHTLVARAGSYDSAAQRTYTEVWGQQYQHPETVHQPQLVERCTATIGEAAASTPPRLGRRGEDPAPQSWCRLLPLRLRLVCGTCGLPGLGGRPRHDCAELMQRLTHRSAWKRC